MATPQSAELAAIEREFSLVKKRAGAPREINLGCSRISHKRLEFCSACSETGGISIELAGWRLLALLDQCVDETIGLNASG